MENSHIEEWDLRGWMGIEEPTPYAQREWNKTLLSKIMRISNKIQQSSRRGGADTIFIHPDLEIILHPDHYDDHSKKLINKIDVILDPNMERNRIDIHCRESLNDVRFIPFTTEGTEETMGTIEFKPLISCTDEEIVKYYEGLIGFVLIENI